MLKVAIFSLEKDLHAHAILYQLKKRSNVKVYFVATDAMIEQGGLHWQSGAKGAALLCGYDGEWFSVSDLDLIWWRRVNQPQKECYALEKDEPVIADLISNEWKGSIAGLVHDGFKGVWVNSPLHEANAGNKLYQLNVADALGLRIPRTIVSQDPDCIRNFCAELGGRLIAKKLIGTSRQALATVLLTAGQLRDDSALKMAPCMYQEYIQGTQHVRVNVFGDQVHAILIQSDTLDWRRDLSGPFTSHTLPVKVQHQLVRLVRELGLSMGIMDMMYSKTGELVWLELNTQGQFLFGEALSGYDLTTPFVEFLLAQADGGKRAKAA